MSREIKFRGIPVFGKDFVYGYYNCYKKEGEIVHEIINNDNGTTRYEVKPETVGQYTGLKDIYCRIIYGGDIVRHPKTATIGEIVYNHNGFSVLAKCKAKYDLKGRNVIVEEKEENKKRKNYCYIWNYEWKVIGNIYEDKNLLK